MGNILVCNVSQDSFKIKRSYNWNGLVVPACPKGTPYTSLLVTDHMDEEVHAIDHWAEHSKHIPVKVEASVIVHDFFTNENLKNKGCFIPAGEIPTEEEIAQAHATRRAYLMKCVNEGQSEYSRTGRIDDIPGEYKRAASELGMDFEWAKLAPPQMSECPACAEKIKPGVAICKSCGAILDREKAAKFGLVEAAPVKKEKETRVI